VDVVGHSLGAPVIRLWILETSGAFARDVITIAGANHGNSQACFTTFLGASSEELCPAFAEGDEAVNDVQTELNGAVGVDVDETPFDDDISWTAIAFPNDQIIRPFEVECLDMEDEEDCAAPVNIVLDFDDASHAALINDERVIELVALHLRQ
jgi:triacylglycerol esterase/lipase EstA (alpha/beta hydrolase family)